VGYVLYPGRLYLGRTCEYTESYNCVPFLEGKSSTGRLVCTLLFLFLLEISHSYFKKTGYFNSRNSRERR